MAKERVDVAQIGVDLTTLQGDVKTAEGILRTLKTNLRDLSNLKINANGEISGGLSSIGKELDKSSKGYQTGKDRMKEFYREQRIQDRITRDASQAVIGLTVGLSALSSMTGKTDGETRRATEALIASIAAMQGAEFTATALGIAGRNLSGTMGNVARVLEENAGIIGAVVGVGAGLVTFFMNADTAAKKAAEGGLDAFAKKVSALSPEDQARFMQFMQERYNALKKQEEIQTAARNAANDAVYGIQGRQNESRKAALIEATKQLRIAEEQTSTAKDYLDKAKEAVRESQLQREFQQYNLNILKNTGTEYQKIQLQVEELNKKKEQGIVTDSDGAKIADKLAGLQRRTAEIFQTSDEARAKALESSKASYALGRLTTEQLIAQMRSVQRQMQDKEKALALDKEINDLVTSTKTAEIERERALQEQTVGIAKETSLQLLGLDEQLVLARVRGEEEKIRATEKFAIKRVTIEAEAANQILDIERAAIDEQMANEKNEERRKSLQAQLDANTVKKIALADQLQGSIAAIRQTSRLGLGAAADSNTAALQRAKGGLVDPRAETADVARLSTTKQLNDQIASEQTKLAQTERSILDAKEAAQLEALEKERQISMEKISILEAEAAVRQQLVEQQIVAGFEAFDASKSIEENFKQLAYDTIKRLVAEAVANQLVKVFASVPFPFNALLAPAAGMAAAALFNQLIPKFADGGKLTGPSLRLAGEAGPEFYAPEQTFYDVARREIIPTIADIASRDLLRSSREVGTLSAGGDSAALAAAVKKEMGKVVDAIRMLPAPIVLLKNPIDFRDALKSEYQLVKDYHDKKFPDDK